VYAGFLNAMVRPNETIARVEQGLHVDPLSLTAVTDVGWELYFALCYVKAAKPPPRNKS
jgi:hypothetical protein